MGVETRRAGAAARTGAKKGASPPILSHEFVIQNHGDIMSCVLMVVVVGFMFPLTSGISNLFVAPQYNETVTVDIPGQGSILHTTYGNGLRDIFAVAFYSIVWITVHAVIQEYVMDKLVRRVHLSKTKSAKFIESGHQLAFAVYAAVHAAYVIMEFVQNHSDIRRVWSNYPEEHRALSLNMKVFAILQISYWVHIFPEFYFQKMKKEEMRYRTVPAVLFILFISAAYTLNLMRFAVVALLVEYVAQAVFHAARLAHFMDKKNAAKQGFKLWNVVFVLVRLATAVLSVTTFWYGLRQSEVAVIDPAAGNYNTSFIRLNCLLAVLALQLVQLWTFLTFHLARMQESRARKAKAEQSQQSAKKPAQKKKQN